MSSMRCLRGVGFASLVLMMACAKPPTQEMAAAESAVKAAAQAGALDYAPDEMATAQAALQAAQAKVAGKDYKGAKAAAIDAKAKGDAAAAAAAANLKTAQAQAQQGIAALQPGIEALTQEAAGLKGKGVEQAQADAASLGEAWKGVQADFQAGQFKTVQAKLADLQTRAAGLKTSIEEAKKAAAKPAKKGKKGKK